MAQANFDAEIRLDIRPFIQSIGEAQAQVKELSGQIDALNNKTPRAGGSGAGAGGAQNAGAASSAARKQMASQEIAQQKQIDSVYQESYQQEKRRAAETNRTRAAASQQQDRNLARERYALYDVAAAYTAVAGAASLAVVATAGTAINFERAFVDVARTTDFVSVKIGAAAESAKNDLKSLAAEIPVAFGQITQIATIGNQLGIAQGALTSFTETVAKFSAATGVTVDATAMSFGRIGELLQVDAKDFEAMGSAIAFAGVNAVATEEQILSVTREIATTAKMANFTTPDIIGLSTALSSLGIAPEAARGSIIRTFAGINKAVSEGGAALEEYARIAGMPSQQFAKDWSDNGQVAFGSFLRGLQGLADGGANLDSVLRNLGMVNVRDIQTVQKLGDNYDVYTSSIQDANKGFSDGTFLAESYGQIQETVAAKLLLVQNNIANLLDTLGQGAVGETFKSILDIVNELLIRLNQFAKTPVGQAFGFLVTVGGSLVAVIAAINAVSALAAASLRAFATAQTALLQTTPATTAAVATLNTELAKTGPAGATASLGLQKGKIALQAVGTALKAIAWTAVVSLGISALGKLADAFSPVEQRAENLLGGFSGLQEALGQDYVAALETYGTDAAVGLAIASKEIRGQTVDVESNNEAVRKAAELQEGLAVIAGTDLTNGVKDATDEIKTQNVVLGENFNAWVRSSIASSQAFQEFAMDTEAMSALREIGFDIQDAINIAAEGGSVLQYIRDLGYEAEKAGNLSADASVKLGFLLAQSNVPFFGNGLGDFVAGIEGAANQGLILGAVMPEVARATGDAAEEGEEFKKGLEGAAKSLRTVVDYANDLRTIFSRAFEIRFGRRESLDDIASGWNNIAEKAEDAKDEIRKANAEIAELAADRSILEYQLTVAERYGDEQRAAIIRAKIAKIDTNVADKKKDISDATAELTKSTVGNTDSAIENRNILRDQVQSYASYVEMLSKTGLKGKALRDRVAELKEEFRQNGLQAGFSNDALQPYLKTFDDMSKIIKETPRDVDIKFKANISPAEQALREFIARVNNSSGTVTINTKYTGDPPPANTTQQPVAAAPTKGTTTNPYTTGIMPGMSLPPGTRTFSAPLGSFVQMPKGLYMHGATLSGANMLLRYGSDKNNINGKAVKISGNLIRLQTSLAGDINALTRFADGGLVSGRGTGTSDSIPAMLSNGEFVVKASAVGTYGVDFLNAINQQKVGSFTSNSLSVGGASTSTIAHLSPEDRSLLRAVIDRPVNLYTENAKIASSANAGNVVLAQRGTN